MFLPKFVLKGNLQARTRVPLLPAACTGTCARQLPRSGSLGCTHACSRTELLHTRCGHAWFWPCA